MYWLASPPLLRYAAATLVVAVALWADLRPEPTEPRWVARDAIGAGTRLDPSSFDEVAMPVGVLPRVEPTGVAAIPLAAGEPLLPGHVLVATAPEGWWVVALEIPAHLPTGAHLRIVLLPDDPTASPTVVPGIVVSPASGGDFSFGSPLGSVAVPGTHVEEVADASSRGRVVVAADR